MTTPTRAYVCQLSLRRTRGMQYQRRRSDCLEIEKNNVYAVTEQVYSRHPMHSPVGLILIEPFFAMSGSILNREGPSLLISSSEALMKKQRSESYCDEIMKNLLAIQGKEQKRLSVLVWDFKKQGPSLQLSIGLRKYAWMKQSEIKV